MEAPETLLTRRIQELYVLIEDGHRRALQPVGLTPTQFNLLRAVAAGSREDMTVTRLASALLCSRGNATRLVARMTEMGLLTTRGDERDQRLRLVSLSSAGRQRLREGAERVDVATRQRLASLAPDEVRMAHDAVHRLADVLRQDLDLPISAPSEGGTDSADATTGALDGER